MPYNETINKQVKEAILERYPDADVISTPDGGFDTIEIVKDGVLYTFKTRKKTGSIKFTAKQLIPFDTPEKLLGLSSKQYVRLINTGNTETVGTLEKAEPKGKYRIYRNDDKIIITKQDLPDPNILLSRHGSIGHTVAAVKETTPKTAPVFDSDLMVDLLNNYGASVFENKNFFKFESFETPAKKEEPKKEKHIPYAVYDHVKNAVKDYIDSLGPGSALRFLHETINGSTEEKVISKADLFEIIEKGSEIKKKKVSGIAVLAHYMHQWVEITPNKWIYVSYKTLIEKNMLMQQEEKRHIKKP